MQAKEKCGWQWRCCWLLRYREEKHHGRHPGFDVSAISSAILTSPTMKNLNVRPLSHPRLDFDRYLILDWISTVISPPNGFRPLSHPRFGLGLDLHTFNTLTSNNKNKPFQSWLLKNSATVLSFGCSSSLLAAQPTKTTMMGRWKDGQRCSTLVEQKANNNNNN